MNARFGIACDHARREFIENQAGEVIAWSCNGCSATGSTVTRSPAPITPPEPVVVKDRCECNRIKKAGALACGRCVYLDGLYGNRKLEELGVLISILRTLDNGGGVTIADLMAATGRAHESILRSLQNLQKRRRVIRRREAFSDESMNLYYGYRYWLYVDWQTDWR